MFCFGAAVKGGGVAWTLHSLPVGLDSVGSICVFGISKYFGPGAEGGLGLRGRSEAILSSLRDKQMKSKVKG